MIAESRVPVNKPTPLSGLIKTENKTHRNHASEITLFSLYAKQVNLSRILYKSHKFCQAFSNAVEQLSGNPINQSNQYQVSQSVIHHHSIIGEGERRVSWMQAKHPVGAELATQAGAAGAGCRAWSLANNSGSPRLALCFAPLLVGLPVLG